MIYLFSGPLETGGFPKIIREQLKIDLKNIKTIVLICTKPNNFEKNNIYKKRITRDLKEVCNPLDIILLDNRINKEDGINFLKNADMIYLLGGNPLSQLEYIKDNEYNNFIDKNKIIMGTSAGAMNLAKHSYYSKDDDLNESFFYDGLGLTDVTVDPHFDLNNKEQVNEFKKYNKVHKIYGLDNDSAIKIFKDKVSFFGNIYKED